MPPVLAAIPAVIASVSATVAAATPAALAASATAAAATAGVASLAGSMAVYGAVYAGAAIAETTLLSYAANLLQSRPSSGVQWRTAQGSLETRRIPCGKVYTSGRSMGDAITWGDSNRSAVILTALADVPIGGISSFQVTDNTDTFNGLLINGYPAKFRNSDPVKGYEIQETVNPFTREQVENFLAGNAWKFFVQFYLGEDGQTADQWMVDNVPSAQWDSTAVGTNLAYHRAYAYYDSNIFSGFPTFAYYLDGALMYDPSQDTTVGGSGSHLWGTFSTYQVSTNPAVIAYNIARGFFNSAGEMVYGCGYAAADLPLDFWIPAIQDCDELITDKDGTQSPRYSCSFEIDITEEPRKYLSICETAMAGRICQDRGQLLAYAGVAQTPIFTFTDADKVQSAANLYNEKLGLDNLKNIVTGKFLSVAECFVQLDAPPRESDDDIAEDGGIPLTDAMDLSMIMHGPTSQRVMEATRQRHRAQATCTRTFLLPALNARKGQWIAGTSDDWTGTKWFEIVKAVTNIYNLAVTMALREVPYDLGDWDADTDELNKYTVSLSSADPVDPLEATGISAAPLDEQGGDGSSPAGIAVTYIATDDPSATQVELQIGQIVASGSDGVSNSTTAFSDSVAVAFNPDMEGSIIVIEGAGADGAQYTGTIADYVSAASVALTDATETSAASCAWMTLGDTQNFYDSDTTSGVIKATNLLGETPYAYRVKIAGIEGRQAVWSDWHTVTTPSTILPDGSVSWDALNAELQAAQDAANLAQTELQTAQDAANLAQTEAQAALDDAHDALADTNLTIANLRQKAAQHGTRQETKLEAIFQSSLALSTASITEQLTVFADADEAFAESLLTTESQLTGIAAGSGTVLARIVSAETTAASATAAVADRTTTVEAALSGYTGSGAVSAGISAASTAYVTPLAGLASTVSGITTQLTGMGTGSGSVSAAISAASTAYVTPLAGLASTVSGITTQLTGMGTGSGSVSAAISAASTAYVTPLAGLASTVSGITTQLTGMGTGSGSVSAAISAASTAYVTPLAGLASTVSGITTQLTGMGTGSGSVSAAISAASTAYVTPLAGLASTVSGITTQLTGMGTGSGSVSAAISAASTAYVTPLAGLASTVSGITTQLTGMGTGSGSVSAAISAASTAYVTTTNALASSLNTVTASLGTATASGYWSAKAVAAVDGAVVSVEMGATLTAGGTLGSGAVGVDIFSDGTSRVRLKGGAVYFQDSSGNNIAAIALDGTLNVGALIVAGALTKVKFADQNINTASITLTSSADTTWAMVGSTPIQSNWATDPISTSASGYVTITVQSLYVFSTTDRTAGHTYSLNFDVERSADGGSTWTTLGPSGYPRLYAICAWYQLLALSGSNATTLAPIDVTFVDSSPVASVLVIYRVVLNIYGDQSIPSGKSVTATAQRMRILVEQVIK